MSDAVIVPNALNPKVEITIGGRKRTMVFNVNTYSRYEEATGKFFLKTIAELLEAVDEVTVEENKINEQYQAALRANDKYGEYQAALTQWLADRDAAKAAGHPEPPAPVPPVEPPRSKAVFRILSKVSMKDLRALIWASLAENERRLTIDQVGGWIDHQNLSTILGAFMQGDQANTPSKEELEGLPEPEGDGAARPTPVTVNVGGESSGQ